MLSVLQFCFVKIMHDIFQKMYLLAVKLTTGITNTMGLYYKYNNMYMY